MVIGNSSVSTSRDLARILLPYFTPENLFVISTDFSHYPSYEDARRIDQKSGQAILENDPRVFYQALRSASNSGVPNLATPCCSWSAVMTLLYMTENSEGLSLDPVLYQNSGDVSVGDRERVVGYWAIAGHQPVSETFVLLPEEKELLTRIARQTLESYVQKGILPEIQSENLPEALKTPAGAFVSLYKHGELRGCIGNFRPEEPLYRVVQEMTVSAASKDPRFYPVREGECDFITLEISVLTPLQPIEDASGFELGRHGIYMVKDGKSGTYLPQVAATTGWNKEEFLGHCARDKAGIGWEGWKEADLFVYEAIIFGEEE
jgi:AmmeMemoRadiSam system protein A